MHPLTFTPKASAVKTACGATAGTQTASTPAPLTASQITARQTTLAADTAADGYQALSSIRMYDNVERSAYETNTDPNNTCGGEGEEVCKGGSGTDSSSAHSKFSVISLVSLPVGLLFSMMLF